MINNIKRTELVQMVEENWDKELGNKNYKCKLVNNALQSTGESGKWILVMSQEGKKNCPTICDIKNMTSGYLEAVIRNDIFNSKYGEKTSMYLNLLKIFRENLDKIENGQK